MSIQMKKLKFWGSCGAQFLAASFLLAFVFMLLYSVGDMEYETVTELAAVSGFLFPFYFVMFFSAILMTLGISMFQNYFSLLVSFGARRAASVRSILLFLAALSAVVLLISWLILTLATQEPAESLALMPMFGGFLFLMAALSVFLGVLMARYGKLGMLFFIIAMILIGSLVGGGMIILGKNDLMQYLLPQNLSGIPFDFRILLAAGIAAYLLSGVFALVSLRNHEVRV